MKRMLCFVLAAACVLGLAACKGNVDAEKEILTLVQTVEKTEEELTELLKDTDRDALIAAWGEPDGMLSGFWGDIWYTGTGCRYVVVYYEEGQEGQGLASDVKQGEWPGLLWVYGEKTPEGQTVEEKQPGMLSQEQVAQLKAMVKGGAGWMLDAAADRETFVFDGEFTLAGDETVYRFSLDQRILFAEGESPRFRQLTNSEVALIRVFLQKTGWN